NNKLLAIKLLYELYADKIFGLMVKKLSDRNKAEELLEKTFSNVYELMDATTGHEFSFTMLMRIARKICNPQKNHVSDAAVTMEDRILEMIICNGATISEVANILEMTDAGIRTTIKSSLMKYKPT
ncbi:MAG: hypothetical protein ACHQFW_10535, partial [Chitinophagales bacterium]